MTDETDAPQGVPQGEPASVAESVPASESATEQETPPANGVEGTEAKPDDHLAPEKFTKAQKMQKRMDALTAEKYEALHAAEREKQEKESVRRQNEALLAELSRLKGNAAPAATPPEQPTQTPGQQQPQLNQQDIDRLVEERAAAKAREAQFTAACNKTYEAGRADFKDDFDEAVRRLGRVGVTGKQELLETVTEMPEGHKVLHHLSGNLDEAVRIAAMPPARMALELARIEASFGKPAPHKPISGAPAPIRPVQGNGKAEPRLDDPNLPFDQWRELRNKQREARGKR